MACITVSSTVNYGASIRIGYRIKASSSPFTYVPDYPTQADMPYSICGLANGIYEVEIVQICPNCSGGIFSDPIITDAIVL